ncbi:hypothetical protein [Rhizobium sp. BK251]|uniref:hypothetical protein n=1 Tax=Rhizobium sp. BK251 TaxID=2512125 RepID=UPI00104F2AE8|nr:hypothetical protein [Rhizobium sp. BK251]TCL75682.1 hypothetical protein EV286_101225 [Rhizobium sp. BK251]
MQEYLAYRGGPFFNLQRRLGLIWEASLNAGRRALIFVGIAWLVPLVLTLPGSMGPEELPFGNSYLTDIGAWGKYVIAIAAFLLSEKQVEERLRLSLRQFLAAPLLDPSAFPAAAGLIDQALNRRDSRVAEWLFVLLGYLAAAWSLGHLFRLDHTSWAVVHGVDGNHITLAGWWTTLVSLPLFWFLMLRGLWRHLVWAMLLRAFAGLRLRLVASHPDSHGGLGFLADYPNAYAVFVLGVSAAAAAAFAKHLSGQALIPSTLTTGMMVWLAFVVALFAFSLSAFRKPLRELKEASLMACSTQATQYQRKLEKKMLGRNTVADNPDEFDPAAEPQDPGKLFESARKLSPTLTSRSSIVPLAAAALLPYALVGFSQIPFKEVLSIVKKLILI